MKSVILFLLFFSFNNSFSQQIEGFYKYASASIEKDFEIEIKSDSTYILKPTEGTVVTGKIKNKSGKFYFLIQTDSIANKDVEYIVKITRKKMIFYGYKFISPRKTNNRLVKAFKLEKSIE